MSPRLRLWGTRVGYVLFCVVCLAVFISWTFPYDKLKERIVLTFNSQQRAGGAQQELQIDSLTSSWVTGVKATGVRLLSLSTDPTKPPVELKIDSAKARVSVLAFLFGRKKLSFALEAFDGTISGYASQGGTDREVEVELAGVDIGKVEPLTSLLGLPMEGKLSGTIHLELPDGRASKGTGTVALEATDVALGDGKAKLKGALALPRLVVGNLSVAAEAKEGVLRVTKLSASGKDVDVSGEGKVQMRELANESICDVNVKFKINDAYRTKSEVTKSLFGAPGSNAPPLFELVDPKVKQAKRSDGFYAFHMRGLLGRPEFEAQGSTSSSAPAPGGAGFSLPKVNP